MVSLHIDTGREMRGGQWQALYLLRGLMQQGQAVKLLAPQGSPLLQAALAQRLDARRLGVTSLLSASYGVDVVHAHDARGHSLGLMLGKPLVVSRRVAFAVKRGFPSRWKYRHATHYIAVSNFVREKLLEAGVDEARITVIYDGVMIPPSSGQAHRERILALDSDDPGKCKALVEKAVGLAGIPIAFSKNLDRDLPESGLFVYLTESEGLGSAALLAMAYGVPVIASAVGGLPEIVEDGSTGVLTVNEPEAVAQQIRRLMQDRTFASRLATAARRRVEKAFSVERMVRETLAVYERMVV